MLGGDGMLVVLDCLTAEDRLVAAGVDDGVFPVPSDVEDMLAYHTWWLWARWHGGRPTQLRQSIAS
jgi:hypothetical protein